MNIKVAREPLFDGERRPNRANPHVLKAIRSNCKPEPTRTDKSIGFFGGLKTSPSDENVRHDDGQSDHNNGEVDQREPLNFRVVNVQVFVPSSCPDADIRALINGLRVDNNTHNTVLVLLSLVVFDDDVVVVVKMRSILVVHETNVETRVVESGLGLLVQHSSGCRQPINKPVVLETCTDVSVDKGSITLGVNIRTQSYACFVFQHFELVWRIEDSVTKDHRAERLALLFWAIWMLAEMESWEIIVVRIKVRFCRTVFGVDRWRYVIHQQWD
ncbi:hypothetical protein OGAPHI_001911 [Ogataea philodendri]|uniref:Uncharacterized protein n=1 Tax=Ogataea philodendri TaxID=1378263 RepID=A0A9P8PB80_9ASCO|nr:uncharacterized protein OGAPHI_001911 [Ogataea philodendri]KAH3668157.1 hypothetical protein OGAPHI_001911 [Ogataea philodendri]